MTGARECFVSTPGRIRARPAPSSASHLVSCARAPARVLQIRPRGQHSPGPPGHPPFGGGAYRLHRDAHLLGVSECHRSMEGEEAGRPRLLGFSDSGAAQGGLRRQNLFCPKVSRPASPIKSPSAVRYSGELPGSISGDRRTMVVQSSSTCVWSMVRADRRRRAARFARSGSADLGHQENDRDGTMLDEALVLVAEK
jgi:hypothetical protein